MFNKKQKIALWIGIVLVALMGFFPPWKRVTPFAVGTYLQSSMGYAWVFSPPESDGLSAVYSSIDFSRLLLQWAVVAVVTGGLVVTLGERRDDARKT